MGRGSDSSKLHRLLRDLKSQQMDIDWQKAKLEEEGTGYEQQLAMLRKSMDAMASGCAVWMIACCIMLNISQIRRVPLYALSKLMEELMHELEEDLDNEDMDALSEGYTGGFEGGDVRSGMYDHLSRRLRTLYSRFLVLTKE